MGSLRPRRPPLHLDPDATGPCSECRLSLGESTRSTDGALLCWNCLFRRPVNPDAGRCQCFDYQQRPCPNWAAVPTDEPAWCFWCANNHRRIIDRGLDKEREVAEKIGGQKIAQRRLRAAAKAAPTQTKKPLVQPSTHRKIERAIMDLPPEERRTLKLDALAIKADVTVRTLHNARDDLGLKNRDEYIDYIEGKYKDKK
jgi:hypothetical protein